MGFAAILADPSCVLCGRRTGGVVCSGCAGALERPPEVETPTGLDACHVLTGYFGTGRDLVTALKFRGHRVLAPWLADRLGRLVVDEAVDVLTWAPTSRARRRARGFDQAELLARGVGRRLRIPVVGCLARLPGSAQTGQHRSERLAGPRFDGRRGLSRSVRGRGVVVVDDVITTGATLTAAAAVLRAAGAARVQGLAVAWTPPARS